MKHSVIFSPEAFADYNQWAVSDKQIFKKIIDLIKSVDRNPFDGIGKPEPLKHKLKGCWSRRITDEHRLVYQVISDSEILIISCKFHYS